MVTAPKSICQERVLQRDQISEIHFLARYNSQIRHEEQLLSHYFSILNDETTPLLPQIWNMIESIKEQP